VTGTDPFIHTDAAYVLGALDAADRAAFEEHLRTCDECTMRVAELQPMPSLLALLSEDDFQDGPPETEAPPDTLLPGLLRRVRQEQRRRRWITGGLAAVAAACVLTLAIVLWPTSNAKAPAPQALTALVASPVRATASLDSVQWGTMIHIDCYYTDSGSEPPGWAYTLTVVDRSGAAHDLGSWTLTPGRETQFPAGTSLPRSQIAKVQIKLNGQAILQLAT
jgi:hypothetical protein